MCQQDRYKVWVAEEPKNLNYRHFKTEIKTMEELFPSARPDYSYVIYYEAVYVM